MREEIIEIAKKFQEWAIKHEKKYLAFGFAQGNIIINANPDDKDYKDLLFYIDSNGEVINLNDR